MSVPVGPHARGSFLELMGLEEAAGDCFRASTVFPDSFTLYGGQVAAQALVAAGRTVPRERLPHSLHAYFLSPGRSEEPTDFQVFRERDGRSFSARRVVAVQRGRVILQMTASFHHPEPGADHQVHPMPVTPPPVDCAAYEIPRLWSVEGRLPPQPVTGLEWPVRFWARVTEDLAPGELLRAAALTYVSDISTGLSPLCPDDVVNSSSLDHAMWFHRWPAVDDWVLCDLAPHSTSAARGWYTGALYHADGSLLASLAQEALFR